MYDERIERLRTHAKSYEEMFGEGESSVMMREAADAIEKLQAYVALYKDGGETAMKVANDYKARLEKLNKPRWIPVTERLPKKNGDYLVYTVGGSFNQLSATEMAFWDNDKFIVKSFLDVTHWMPLPEPPESEDET